MDIRQELLAAFDAEQREHVAAIRDALASVAGGGTADMKEVFRRAHSLKGAARAVDAAGVEAIANALESLFQEVLDEARRLDAPLSDAVVFALDTIEAEAAAATGDGSGGKARGPEGALAALALAGAGGRAAATSAGTAVSAGQADRRPDGPATPVRAAAAPVRIETPGAGAPDAPPIETAASGTDGDGPQPAAGTPAGLEYLRVSSRAVDALDAAMGELVADLAGRERLDDALRSVERELAALSGLVATVAKGPGAGQRLGEVEARLQAQRRRLQGLVRDATRQSFTLERAAGRAAEAARRVALVPVETVLGRFGRMMRDLGRETGVDLVYETEGLDLSVERRILQALKDPVLHALRNAVGHGGEPPEVRRRAGRPPAFTVRLSVEARHGHLVVTIRDDGPGPNLPAIERVARQAGLIPPGLRSDRIAEERLLRLVFEPGFSTAGRVDRLSGRGMGLSVVAEAVRGARGRVDLRRLDPHGTELVLEVPLNATVQPVVVLEAGGATFALPSRAVERLLRVPVAALGAEEGRPAIWAGPPGRERKVPVVALPALTGVGPSRAIPTEAGYVRIAVVARGRRRLGLAVEALDEARPMTVESVAGFVTDNPLVAGCVLVDGRLPAAVLDPDGLVDRWLTAEAGDGGPVATVERQATGPAERPTILVVDDSITTRTLEKSILEAQGYRVLLSVDGLDALDLLRSGQAVVDLVVADIEMPRMDGFTLLQAIRNDARLGALPVILMTSRAAPEDVRRGLDLGANAYVTKQKFDQRELLATIGELV